MQTFERLVAMCQPKRLKDVATRGLCARPQAAEVRRAKIRDAQRVERAGLGACRADVARLRLHTVERRRVLAHEVFGPRRAGEIGREPALTKADAPPAVPVIVPRTMLRQCALCPQHWSEPHCPQDWSEPHSKGLM